MDILDLVCDNMDVCAADLRNCCRKKELISAKRVVIYIMRKRGFSSTYIGKYLHCDHTTVIHNLRKITEEETSLGEKILSTLPNEGNLLSLKNTKFEDEPIKKKVKFWDYKNNKVIEEWIVPHYFENGEIVC